MTKSFGRRWWARTCGGRHGMPMPWIADMLSVDGGAVVLSQPSHAGRVCAARGGPVVLLWSCQSAC